MDPSPGLETSSLQRFPRIPRDALLAAHRYQLAAITGNLSYEIKQRWLNLPFIIVNCSQTQVMIITVFGATGQVGKRIVSQALAAGHYVRAFGRNVAGLIDEDMRNNQLEAIQGYVFNDTDVFDAVEGADAVLSVLGGAFDGADKTRSLGIQHIATQMEKAKVKRIIALGGYGVLEAPGGGFLIDQPGYPEQYIPVGKEHLQAYLNLRNSPLDYTFVCAPDIQDEDGRGSFITAADYPPVPNHFKIAAGDIARFMLEELKDNRFIKQRVGISNI